MAQEWIARMHDLVHVRSMAIPPDIPAVDERIELFELRDKARRGHS